MLTLDEAKTAQSQPGFNLPQAAEAATVGSPTYQAPTANAATGTGYTAPFSSSPVTTSGDFRNYSNNLNNNISSTQTNGNSLMQLLGMFAPSTKEPTQPDNSIYENRRTALTTQKQSELDLLQSNYEAKKASTEAAQTKDLAPIQQRLDLLGGAGSIDGGPNAGPNAAVYDQLQLQKAKIMDSYKLELNTLFQAQQSSVLQASKAYGDQDFALAEAENKNAQNFQNQFYQRQKDFASLFLQIYGQQRQDDQLALQEQQAQQKYNSDNKIISAFYQLPGSPIVYDSRTGKEVTSQQYAQMGGVGTNGGYKDIQVVQPQAQKSGVASYDEWALYKQQGGKLGYNDYMTMDANRKRSVTNTINNFTDQTKQFDLQIKQAPAQVSNLKNQGYGWDQIANYFNKLGIDPGTPEIDDALHRAFQSQGDYEKWKTNQYNSAHGLPLVK